MRIRSVDETATFDACSQQSSGETEDYSVNILCVPTYSNILSNDTTLCAGSILTLNAGQGAIFEWNTGDSTSTIDVQTSGIYAVTVKDELGCQVMDSIQVTVNPLVSAGSISYGQTSYQGNNYHFTPNGVSNATSYDWNFGDGSAHSTVLTPDHKYTQTGDYIVTLIVSNSCNSDSVTTTLHLEVAGLSNVISDEVKIYPNPTSTVVNFVADHQNEMESIQIFNLVGQVIFSTNVKTNNFQFNASKLAEGVYPVQINFENGQIY